MNNLRHYVFAWLTTLATILIASGCASNSNKQDKTNYEELMACDSLPDIVKSIVKAVYTNDSSLFAKEVSYPLQRPYPLKDITNEKQMKSYYRVIVDDSLRNVILNSSPSEWQSFGWRGYSLHDGSYIWADGSVYSINYISKNERQLMDSLIQEEINSLPDALGKDWSPILTLSSEETGKVYRIDSFSPDEDGAEAIYRLSIYENNSPGTLGMMPAGLMEGQMELEGSANTVSYIFKDSAEKEYAVYPDDPFTGVPTLYLPDGKQVRLNKSYWYDLIK